MDAGSSGDLGRRIAQRRAELGLDRAEVAFRAGVDPGYLAYLEEHPAATAQPSTVRRLAVALATTWEPLAGIGFGDPVGAGRAARWPFQEPKDIPHRLPAPILHLS
jgi:transcriptional regulator with XRE-family HTH domain